MKKLILSFCLTLIACSDVEFSQTDEGLRKKLNENDIQINYGSVYTQDSRVHLSILGKLDQEMYVTNDPSCRTGGEWEQYQPEKNWTLTHLNQNSNVYVKFKGERSVESDCLSDDIIHDNIPPILNFNSAPNYLNNFTKFTIGLTAKDNVSGVAETFCALEGNDEFVKCYDKLFLQDLSEGEHRLAFTAIDNAGNKSEPILLNWFTDLTPPTVYFNKVPPKLSNSSAFNLVYSGEDESGIAGFKCSINNKNYISCDCEFILHNVTDGQQIFRVMAVDKAGNLSAPISYDWLVDQKIPSVTITKNPHKFTRDPFAELEFVGKDGLTVLNQFECSINNGLWQKCDSPLLLRNLNRGTQSFKVRTIDLAGNISVPAIYNWVIDLTPPSISLLSTPKALTNNTSAPFTILATDNESGVKNYLCWLDDQQLPCQRVNLWSGLVEGEHTFAAAAEDNVGNISQQVIYNWTIDLTPPTMEFTKVPKPFIAENQTEFAYRATDDRSLVVKYECKLMNRSYSDCINPTLVRDLNEGPQSFFVRAVDEAGNTSAALQHSWIVDLTPPVIKLVTKPNDHLNDKKSDFHVQISDVLSGFDKAWCGLKGQLENCSMDQSLSYKINKPGIYEFEVVAMDKVGNRSTLTYEWEIFDKYKNINQAVLIDEKSFNIDILFVVDNSDSMAREQSNMASRISNFINKIEGLNWQIAVTSTDPRKTMPDPYCQDILGINCEQVKIEHGDGGLVKFDNNDYILHADLDHLLAQRWLGNAIQLGTGGSTSEQGIYATYRVLEKSLESKYIHHNDFIREEAAFAVILISDEDESDNEHKNKPGNLISFVNKNWHKKSFKFHSMINLPEFNCIDNDLEFGKEYEKLSRATEGIIGSVCQENYSEDLSSIGEEVKNQVSFVELNCLPQDADGDGKADIKIVLEQGGTVPPYSLKGQKLTFVKPLPAGNHFIQYVCLR
ncbi:MAG: hypothetical protein KDD40_02465 [Bdellovibrionales bacterium]|nr:hypothetical protein [Bdellovibrionales bacterium]